MALDLLALQTAIIQRLKAEIDDVPVYQFVPQNQAYPYIRLEALQVADDGTKSTDMWEVDVSINVFDNGVGPGGSTISSNRRVLAAMKRVAEALHDREFELGTQENADGDQILSDFHVLFVRLDFQDSFQSGKPDDHYHQGATRFRLLIQAL